MKLVFCPDCHDIFNLHMTEKYCSCGKSGGVYTDNVNATIWGIAKPIGFANRSFISSIIQMANQRDETEDGQGIRFEAFVIPKCESIERI